MKNRLARLDKILTYISEHPYSTCAAIATQSKGKALVNLGKEYYMDKL